VKQTQRRCVSYGVRIVARIVVSGRELTELVVRQVILFICGLKS
jgi:hypothetical protein